MSFVNNRPVVSIDLLKLPDTNDDKLITELPSPAMQMAKKRLSKLTNRKTNEQLIKDSHQQLMNYVDNVDCKVQGIIKTYQAQFLQAYLQHVKKVREEMESIKKKSLSAANSERTYIDKIDALQKQLVIFREDSLQSYEKVMIKDKQINFLKSKVSELKSQLRTKDKTIYQLIKINKNLGNIKQLTRNPSNSQEQAVIPQIQAKDAKKQNKKLSDLYSPIAKHHFLDREYGRPSSTHVKDVKQKQKSLQLFSKNKPVFEDDLNWIKRKIIEKASGSQQISVNAVLNLIKQRNQQNPQQRKGSKSNFMDSREKAMRRIESRKSHHNIEDQTSEKKKSKEVGEINELKQILRNCIQQVKKEIGRRNKVTSLNFFKENGPKSYLQFKKTDYFMLMEMLVTNDEISQKLYKLFFPSRNDLQMV